MVEPRSELRPQKSEPTCLITMLTATMLPNKWRKIWVGEATLRVEDVNILNTLKKNTPPQILTKTALSEAIFWFYTLC